jgi:hypothetical protein
LLPAFRGFGSVREHIVLHPGQGAKKPDTVFPRHSGEYSAVEFLLGLSDLFDKTRRNRFQEDALRTRIGCIAAATDPTALFEPVDKLSDRGLAQTQLLCNPRLNHSISERQAGDDQTLVL